MNLALYAAFTIVCFYAAYPPDVVTKHVNAYVADSKLGTRLPSIVRRAITIKRMPKDQVVAVCLCGAAKTQALGIPLANAMWAEHSNTTVSLIQIPVLLYTMEQVFAAQFLTILFRWWLKRDENKESDEESEVAEPTLESRQSTDASGANLGNEKGHDEIRRNVDVHTLQEKEI
jgi:sodium/bile acid cotransporter 7